MLRNLAGTTPRIDAILTVATLLVPVFSVFPAWSAHGAPPQPKQTALAGRDIENVNAQACRELREAIDKRYSYRDMRGVNWDQLFRQYTPALLAASGPDEFAAKTAALLANAKDVHISVEVEGGRRRSTFRTGTPANCVDSLLDRVVPNLRRHNAMVATGRFPDGIAYLMIGAWDARREGDLEAAFQALAEWEKAPGLIIDVRQNGGGAEPLAEKIAGCFINEPAVYAKHVYRDPQTEDAFTPVRERTLAPNAKRPHYGGPIAVLMGPKCISSNEAFLLMMKQVPHCTLVGDRSGGSSGNPKPHKLANGVIVYLPSWKALRPDGTCFEGQGFDPDVRVVTRPADFQKRDPVIDAALRALRKAAGEKGAKP